MSIDFEGGEVLVLLSEDALNVVGVAGSIEGLGKLIKREHEKVDQQVIEWAFIPNASGGWNVYVTVLFDGGDQKENQFVAQRHNNYV